MKTFFITGAGGYIGSKMTLRLLNEGHNVIALDRFFFGDVFEEIRFKNNLRIVKGDTRTFDKNILSDVDVVIDLASISNDPAAELVPELTREINYKGSVRVAHVAREMGVPRYIFAASCSAYGFEYDEVFETSPLHPLSEYARSKVDAEKEILAMRDDTFCVTSLRSATVYGLSEMRMRFDLIVNIMTLHAFKNNKIFITGGGEQWRPLVHIDDAISAFLLVANAPTNAVAGQAFNVGSTDQNFTVNQVAEMFPLHFPQLTIEKVEGKADARSYRVNFDKIKSVLGFIPQKSIHDGIVEIRNALENGEITDTGKTNTVQYYRGLIDAGVAI
jgi:nucleoside-diphosphate-sugar epimerase